jgi:hypothetical protein
MIDPRRSESAFEMTGGFKVWVQVED